MNTCFDNELLERIGQGQAVPDVDLDRLITHLAHCQTCSDQYLNAIRSKALPRSNKTDLPSLAIQRTHEDEYWPPPAALIANPKWEILDLLDAGGMGVVYLARDRNDLERLVALKVIHPSVSGEKEFLGRFQREAQLLREIEPHPNVIAFVDTGQVQHHAVLVMEFVPGRSMHDFQSEFPLRQVPIQTAIDVTLQALSGLEHVWNATQLVHRDISPMNLLIDWNGGLKILDFGLAKSKQPDKPGDITTHAQMMGGTSGYCAPEQDLDFGNVDFRADLYSLGCTLFEMVTGEPVFGPKSGQATDMAVRLSHHTDPTRLAGQVNENVPAELSKVIDQMLCKDPSQRFDSFRNAAIALLPFADQKSLLWIRRSNPPWIQPPKQPEKPALKKARGNAFSRIFIFAIALLLIGCLTSIIVFQSNLIKPTGAKQKDRMATLVKVSGRWEIEDDKLCHYDGNGEQWLLFGDPNWSDYRFRFKCRHLGFPTGFSALFRSSRDDEIMLFSFGWIDFRTAQIRYRENDDFFVPHQTNGQPYFKRLDWEVETERWYQVEVDVQGNNAACTVDGKTVFDVQNIPYSRGRTGIRFWRQWQGKSEFRDIEVLDSEGDILWSGLPELPNSAQRSKNR